MRSPVEKEAYKALVILGPTASGKSSLAVKLAKTFHGEVISADSRQVYRNLDIGTAKISKRGMRGIPHHLLDVAAPLRNFGVVRYQKLAARAIKKILVKRKLPIICGGTGHYIDSLLGAQSIPNVPPNQKLRGELEKLGTAELFARLQKLDPRRAAEIDKKNPRRLIRALEIIITTGSPVPMPLKNSALPFARIRANGFIEGAMEVLKIGLKISPPELRKRINARLQKDLKLGLIGETKNLHRDGLTWKRLDELGLEYRYVSKFLRGEIKTKKELEEKLRTELWRYAKRQMTWFKRDKNIRWIKNEREAQNVVKKFLTTTSLRRVF